MRVLMFSKALVIGAYQRKLEELAKYEDVELTVMVPPYWKEGEHRIGLERRYTSGYQLVVENMTLNGSFHLHFYPRLAECFRNVRPHLVHIDEEPYNLATLHAMWLARRSGVKTVFFTWQNIYRRLPFPFNLIERYNLNVADCAIAGSKGAEEVLLKKEFRGPVAVIPQFGVDPELYSPNGGRQRSSRFVIGYVGRMIEAKGLITLIEAVVGLEGAWELRLIGEGPLRPRLEALTTNLGIAEQTTFVPYTPSVEIPSRLRELDVLVLPSLTTRSWKEQFGRVLVEAMACAVPVIGSDSGEIPNVIDDAGLVFPEGDVAALRQRLSMLMGDEALRLKLADIGRERVLASFTQAKVAEQTYEVYRNMVS
ncbi:MAG: glycosyltransferase family 4 protein [Chloroflexi bacterium]|nr:glycosyltransferase family 4 protein [Chloroflexota bacterium]